MTSFEKADIGKYDHECFRTAVRYGRFFKTPGDRRSYCAGWGRFVESGKKYMTTVSGIMEVNSMDNENVKTGDKLLIFKENMSIL